MAEFGVSSSLARKPSVGDNSSDNSRENEGDGAPELPMAQAKRKHGVTRAELETKIETLFADEPNVPEIMKLLAQH